MAKRKKVRPDIDDHDESAVAPMHKKMMREGMEKAPVKKGKKKGNRK